jgi:hypothetical protein
MSCSHRSLNRFVDRFNGAAPLNENKGGDVGNRKDQCVSIVQRWQDVVFDRLRSDDDLGEDQGREGNADAADSPVLRAVPIIFFLDRSVTQPRVDGARMPSYRRETLRYA